MSMQRQRAGSLPAVLKQKERIPDACNDPPADKEIHHDFTLHSAEVKIFGQPNLENHTTHQTVGSTIA
jgi:hypothetical protein